MDFKLVLCRKVKRFIKHFTFIYITNSDDFCTSFTDSLYFMNFNNEGIHSTLKHNLNGMLLSLPRVIGFLRESLIRRKLNVDRKCSTRTVKSLLESTVMSGFSNFTKHLTASLTDEGTKLTLDQFEKGYDYKVEKLQAAKDIDTALDSAARFHQRAPSAARFRCLVSTATDSIGGEAQFATGDYYKVVSRKINGSIDVVFISPCGSIACTSPSYARWGIPSKHILAVFCDGSITINMKQHFHRVYHLQFMNDIAVDSVADYSVASDIPNGPLKSIDSTACWDWAQKTSEESWDIIGKGGNPYRSVAYPSATSITNAPESITEKTKKAINFVVPYINNSVEERAIFYLYYEGLLQR